MFQGWKIVRRQEPESLIDEPANAMPFAEFSRPDRADVKTLGCFGNRDVHSSHATIYIDVDTAPSIEIPRTGEG